MPTDSEQKVGIKVYWLEKSRSQRLLWLLEELKLKYDIETFKRTPQMLAPPELKKIHPLGKAPIIGVTPENATEPIILAESGAIVEYLCDYFGKWLVPKRYAEGKEGQLGGETEEWMRYRYFMHYSEGSLMPNILVGLVAGNIKNAPVPFFLKFITKGIAAKIDDGFVRPNYDTNFGFLEQQLATSPNGGDYFCGKELTAADIMISFQLEAAGYLGGIKREAYPKLYAFLDKIHAREAYQKAIKRVEETTGEKYVGV